jgi:hypothetical protein
LIGAELGQRYGTNDLDSKQPMVYPGTPVGAPQFVVPKCLAD